MKNVLAVAAAAALASSLSACESKPQTPTPPAPAAASPAAPPEPAPAPAPSAPPSGTVSETLVTGTATVEKVDVASRHVTLRNAEGRTITVKCPPEVRNLPQVNVGDECVVQYYESVAYEVKRAGDAAPGVTVTGVAGRAKEGGTPAAGVGTATTVTVTIEAIDKPNGSLTLRGPDRSLSLVKVRDPSKLDQVSVGDLVEITYTEAMAVSVQPKK
jgi:hypothetical protein